MTILNTNFAIMDNGDMHIGESEEFIDTYSHRISFYFESAKDLLDELQLLVARSEKLREMQEEYE